MLPTSDNATTTEITYVVNFEEPGDFYEFTVDAVNKGSIDAMVEATPALVLSDPTLSNVLISSITYENGALISQYDILPAVTGLVTYKVRVEHRTNLSEDELINENKSVGLSFSVTYIQADGNEKEIDDEPVMKIITGDGTRVGDEIEIGDEHFYIISNDGTTINALAKYNLNVGDNANTSVPLGIQHESVKGWISSGTKYGNVAFANSNGWQQISDDAIDMNDIQAYEGTVKSALNAYKEVLPDGIEVRLISRSELIELGCSYNVSSELRYKNAPSWVYSTSYWSGHAIGISYSVVWAVYSNGNFGRLSYGHRDSFGVRPVISFEI